ncbi:MAG TPA: hypothetical protein VFU86_11755 [Terriglobales bacterium]|nr:hypothetical protein [Terriglobales bacterium]
MKKIVLGVAIVCTALAATAQSDSKLQKKNIVHRDLAARETGSGMATGKTTAADDWSAQQKTKSNMSGAQSNPMYKDNKNSGSNPLYQGNDRNATKTRSNIQNNIADVDGDGASDRAIVKSKSNITNNRAAAGDVNGDGSADAAVSPNSAPAQMKGDFSRGHQPDRKAPAANSNTPRDAQSSLATGKRQHD